MSEDKLNPRQTQDSNSEQGTGGGALGMSMVLKGGRPISDASEIGPGSGWLALGPAHGILPPLARLVVLTGPAIYREVFRQLSDAASLALETQSQS